MQHHTQHKSANKLVIFEASKWIHFYAQIRTRCQSDCIRAKSRQETPPMYGLNGLSGAGRALLVTYTNQKHLNGVTKSITGMGKIE